MYEARYEPAHRSNCMYVCIHAYIHTYINMDDGKHLWTCSDMYAYIHICMYVWHVCIHICMYVCMASMHTYCDLQNNCKFDRPLRNNFGPLFFNSAYAAVEKKKTLDGDSTHPGVF